MRFVLAFLGVLAAVGILAFACSDDDGLTLEEYLREVETTFDIFYAGSDRLQEDASAAVEQAETDEQKVVALRDLWASLDSLYRQAVSDVADLRPPAEARDAHDRWLAVENEGSDLVNELNDRAQRATSLGELVELNGEFEGPDATDLSERSRAACDDLQSIADENDVAVDLKCEN